MSIQVLNISKEKDFITTLGNLFLCLTSLSVKVFSYMQAEFRVFQFVPVASYLSLGTTEESLAPSSSSPPIPTYLLTAICTLG